MAHGYWNDWYFIWGWFLWFGICFLLLSNFGQWFYSYRSNRRTGMHFQKTAIDLLNERYARGDIDQAEFKRIKIDIGHSEEPLSHPIRHSDPV